MRKRQARPFHNSRNEDASKERRKREKPGTVTGDQADEDAVGHTPGRGRKKHAIFFGYVGKGFHGMQRQVNENGEDLVRTVEGVLLKALINCGAISDDQLENSDRLQLSRVGRTDTGVHAACQVVSIKLFSGNTDRATQEGVVDDDASAEDRTENLVAEAAEVGLRFKACLQKELPGDEIEIYDVIRMKGSFDARHKAERRQYEYLLPTRFLRRFELFNNEQLVKAYLKEHASIEEGEDICSKAVSYEEKLEVLKLLENESIGFDAFTDQQQQQLSEGTMNNKIVDILTRWREEMDLLRRIFRNGRMEGGSSTDKKEISSYPDRSLLAYRMEGECEIFSDSDLDRLNLIMGQLVGNHHWMNFTSRMESKNPSGYRVIDKMECYRVPQLTTREEVLVVRIVGQSFLLNQIRKMISISVETFLGTCPARTAHILTTRDTIINDTKKHLHLAPASCLLLERAHFYNCEPATATDPLGFYPLFEDIESDDPFGSEVNDFVQRGILSKRRVLKPLDAQQNNDNCLLLLDEEDEADRPVVVVSPVTNLELNRDERRVRDILRFKFNKLYPHILQQDDLNEHWGLFLNDIHWHPFFLENFPKVRARGE